MKKKTLLRSILFCFLCCMMILGFQTNVKAETGNYYLKVNKGTNVVTAYTHDDKPYTAFVCSAGYATPIGTFYTMNKYTWWTLDGPSYGQYCTRITGSILFHSVWYYQQNKTTQSYVQYNKLGSLASHGCVRVTTAAAKWIYDNCPLRTKVIIFNGNSGDDPLGKPASIKVSTSVSMGWDPTDPDPNNTYATKNTQPKIVVKSKSVKAQYNAKFTPVEMQAYDSAGNKLSNAWIHTSGSVNTKQMGSYPVTYSLTDSFGRTASVTVTYTVGDASKAVISGVRKEITKEYKSTVNLRSKITAKNSMGTVLTDKIVTKIRKPGEKEYKGVRAETLKLNHTGSYRIMYYLKNPTNKLVTQEYMKIIVKDTKKPVIKSTDNFAAIELKAGTTTVNYKKLISGVTAKLASGKSMTSKISIKVTDPDGNVKTVSKNASYKLAEPGTYTVKYYCSNPEKSLKTGKYLVCEKKRKLVLAEEEPEEPVNPTEPEEPVIPTEPEQPVIPTEPEEPVNPTEPEQPVNNSTDPTEPPKTGLPSVTEPTAVSTMHTILAPADESCPVGTIIKPLENVVVQSIISMSDGTQRVTKKTEGIRYQVTYQMNAGVKELDLMLAAGLDLIISDTGIYKIVYTYTDEFGYTTQYIRTITATAASAAVGA
uniref:L,D-TPase catalytic domain-containing protein n=1 Tax=Eubacterium plexicaudatum ASF492 TaxID=1235802 RepID=N2B8J9_9FIRM